MDVQRPDLEEAVRLGLLQPAQVEPLWGFLAARRTDSPRFTGTHVLYYLGGLIAIGAMSLFMTLAWESFGGWGLFAVALAYAGLGLGLTEHFLYRRHLAIPAGIMAAFVVVLVPLATYGLQNALGWWPDEHPYRDYHRLIEWHWLYLELATLAAAALLLWRYRLPFIGMPLAVTLWYMSMDLSRFILGIEAGLPDAWDFYRRFSLAFGLAMTGLAFWVDLRTRSGKDYAFWLYLFGVVTFWAALSSFESPSEWNKFLYFLINLAMVGVATLLARRVFAVCGGLGIAGYLFHLADQVFQDSLLFPLALSLLGIGIIWLGVWYSRHEAALARRLRGLLPGAMADLLERRL